MNTTFTFGKKTKDDFINRNLWGESRGQQPQEDPKYLTINSILG